MPIENSELDELPDWMVSAEKSAVKTLIEFWNENSTKAYTQQELQEETGLSTDDAINLIVELRHSDVIKKKGAYLRPVSIEEAYMEWEEEKEKLK